MDVTEEIGGKGPELLGGFHQPLQHRVGITSKTRAVARMPNPSAKHARTRTISTTAACLP